METYYLLPAQLRVGLVDYLSRRPYLEVADAIHSLQRLEPHEPVGEPQKPDIPD